ncbi:MAG: peptidylprolyl isomerase [Paracoccaceae bacterium]
MATQVAAQDATADTVVATVNGKDITIGHMIVVRDALPAQYKDLPAQTLFDGVLDQLVQQAVLSQSLEIPSKKVTLGIENQTRMLRASEVMVAVVEDAIDDAKIQAAYEVRFAEATESKEFNASHILVETEAEALELVVALEGGADFAELAKEKSTGPSGPNGGELGWFGPGMMVQPFEEAVMAMEIGAISAPVQTQFGWHVLILNDTRLQGPPPLEEVRAELVDALQQAAIDDLVTELTANAHIVRPDISMVNPEILNESGLLK